MTVTLLAVGLIAAGFGTMAFLRNTLVASIDSQLEQLAPTDLAGRLFTVQIVDGEVQFVEKTDVPSPPYFVAVYGPDGAFLGSAGGDGVPDPSFPPQFTLEQMRAQGPQPFVLQNSEIGAPYHASVAVYQVEGLSPYFTQLVALPLAPTERIVAAFVAIYGILAIIVIVAGALGTRWLVTLTFRSLGQVESTAMEIATGDFSQRMTDIEPRTEVGRLKIAINTMLGRIDGALSQRDAALKQMRRFIGDASHELRTPLVTVRGYAELYRMGAITADDDVAQAMERIEKEAKRMGVLVEDLLALARLDERRDIVFDAVDLRPIARDAAMDLRAAAPLRQGTVVDTTDTSPAIERPAEESPLTLDGATRDVTPLPSTRSRAGATLSLLRRKPRPVSASQASGTATPVPVAAFRMPPAATTSARVPPIVLGDENRIRQVVTNLIGNARRFTEADSPIELRVGVDLPARMGWIEIVDHGEGIPEQVREKIFQRFWRADTSRTRETGGTGLGLSIVASIVESLHGAVDVTETPGGGATFRVAFPLAEAPDSDEHLLLETQPLRIPRGTPEID